MHKDRLIEQMNVATVDLCTVVLVSGRGGRGCARTVTDTWSPPPLSVALFCANNEPSMPTRSPPRTCMPPPICARQFWIVHWMTVTLGLSAATASPTWIAPPLTAALLLANNELSTRTIAPPLISIAPPVLGV